MSRFDVLATHQRSFPIAGIVTFFVTLRARAPRRVRRASTVDETLRSLFANTR